MPKPNKPKQTRGIIMKCAFKGWCCDKAEGNECIAAVDFKCDCQISDREYQLMNDPEEAKRADYADRQRSGSGSY